MSRSSPNASAIERCVSPSECMRSICASTAFILVYLLFCITIPPNCNYYPTLGGILSIVQFCWFSSEYMGLFFSRHHLEEDYTGILWESPFPFFNVLLKYNGEMFGSELELQGSSLGEIIGLFQGHYENKKDLTLSKTDNARSSFFVLAWDFRGCQTLPFLRG